MDHVYDVVAREKEIRLKAEAYKRWKDLVLSEKKEVPSKKVCYKQGSIEDVIKRKR